MPNTGTYDWDSFSIDSPDTEAKAPVPKATPGARPTPGAHDWNSFSIDGPDEGAGSPITSEEQSSERSALMNTAGAALPMAASFMLPESVPIRVGAMIALGAAQEWGKQAVEIYQGKRQTFDPAAIGWAGAWTGGAEVGGTLIGSGLTHMMGAGTHTAEEAARVGEKGLTVTPKALDTAQQEMSDEADAQHALTQFGNKMGMSEDQARAMMDDFQKGRAVRQSYGRAVQHIKSQFGTEYDTLLHKFGNAPADNATIEKGIQDAVGWVANTKQTMSPPVERLLSQIEHAAGSTHPGMLTQTELAGMTPDMQKAWEAWAKAGGKDAPPPLPVSQLRAWQSKIRDLQGTYAEGADSAALKQAGDTIHNEIKQALIRGGAKPDTMKALDELDGRYGDFMTVNRTWRRALKDQRSLSQVAGSVFDTLRKDPTALNYMLDAVQKTGDMDKFREAFVNHLWEVASEAKPSGISGELTALDKSKAIRAYLQDYAPGSRGGDIMAKMMMPPGVGQTVGAFQRTIGNMGRVEEAVKGDKWLKYMNSYFARTAIVGGVAGTSLWPMWRKDPAKAAGITLSMMAGSAGLQWVLRNPRVASTWASWISTNPTSEAFIKKGSELAALYLADSANPRPEGAPAPTNVPFP